jgi:hypothetical protein
VKRSFCWSAGIPAGSGKLRRAPCREAGRLEKTPDIIVKRADGNVNQNL